MNKNIGDMTNSELKDFVIELQEENSRYERKIERLEEVIDKAIDKLQLLIDIGFDYDGFNQADSLKTLIDELVGYAKESRNILKGGINE